MDDSFDEDKIFEQITSVFSRLPDRLLLRLFVALRSHLFPDRS